MEQEDIQREFENIVKVEETCIDGRKSETIFIKTEDDNLISSTSGRKCSQCKKLAKIALKEKRRADSLQARNEEMQAIEERLQLDIRNIQNERDSLQEQKIQLASKNEKLSEEMKRVTSSLKFTTEKLNQSRAEFSRLNQKILILKYELSQAKKTDSDVEILEVAHHANPPDHQQTAKAGQSLLQCPECFKTFQRACGLGSHRRIHRK